MRVVLSTYDSRAVGDREAGHPLRRASIGLPPVNDVRTHAFTEHPWLAADPTLAPWQEPADST